MKFSITWIFFVVVFWFFGGINPGEFFTRANNAGKARRWCEYSKENSMLVAICDKLKLRKIPSNLTSNIEILNFSQNRLRELTDDSLKKFTKLAHINFRFNGIYDIQPGAFNYQYDLISLDLTSNGLYEFPKDIFEMAKLKQLYIEDNQLTDEVLDVTVDSGLEFLQLSTNELTRIPRFKFMPGLKHLNVSNNKIQLVTTEDIASFCSLEVLDVSGPMLNIPDCACEAVQEWTKEKNITMFPKGLKCTGCPEAAEDDYLISTKTRVIYKECLKALKNREKFFSVKTLLKILPYLLIGFGFILLVTIYYYLCKRPFVKESIEETNEIKETGDETVNPTATTSNGDELDVTLTVT